MKIVATIYLMILTISKIYKITKNTGINKEYGAATAAMCLILIGNGLCAWLIWT